MSTFTSTNTITSIPYPPPKTFTLTTPPKTDIYAAPAHGYVWTAPYLSRQIKSSTFKRAAVTVSFTWKSIYDQAGLILVFASPSNPNPDATNASTRDAHPQWVKAGLEVNDGKVWASCVARENWADWSLSSPPAGVVGKDGFVKARFEFVRKEGALFVYVSEADGEGKSMIREPQWVFLEGRGEGEARIGVYTCAPDPKGESQGRELEVLFEDWEIEEV